MFQVKYIHLKNFQSHIDTKYEVLNGELSMIYGENKDVVGKKSNGSGKSALLEGLVFSITGSWMRDIKLKELINNTTDEELISVVNLFNPILNCELIIKRVINKSQKVEIFENGKLIERLRDLHPRESDNYIESKLGISFDDILNYYIISKEKYQSFFLTSDSKKKEVINRFSKADLIDPIFDIIQKEIEAKKIEINDQFLIINSLETKIKIYEDEIIDIDLHSNDEFKLEKEKNVISLKKSRQLVEDDLQKNMNKIEENLNSIENTKTAIISVEKQVDSINKDIGNLDIKFKAKKQQIEKLREKNIKNEFEKDIQFNKDSVLRCEERITKVKKEIYLIQKDISEINKHLAGEIECPNCKHKFILADKTFNIEQAKKNILKFEDKEKSLVKDKEAEEKILFKLDQERKQIDLKIKEKEKDLNIIIDKENKEKTVIEEDIFQKRKNLNSQKNSVDSYNNQITSLENENESLLKSCERLESEIEKCDNKIEEELKKENPLIEKRKEILLKRDNVETDLNNKKEILYIKELELENKSNWLLRFKKFKSFLANQSISQIQQQSNYFLDKMKSDITVFIDGFRTLSNGKFKEEINIELSRDGLTTESFGKFSSGEKAKADLACILSMQNIINHTSENGGLDFIAIDEILESVDADGMNDIVNSLNKLNRTVLLIAHSSPNESIDCNRIIVQKRNGISQIIN